MMQTIHEKKSGLFTVKALYDPTHQIGFLQMEGLYNVEMMIETCRAIMKFVETNPVKFTITDALSTKGSFSSASKFMKEEFTPHLEKHGLKAAALCMGMDIFTRFATNQILKLLSTKFENRLFGSLADAQKWIEQKNGASIKLPAD